MSDRLAKFLEKHDICAQYTMPDTPQQNGVVERCNRTLMDIVRSMMNNFTLPNPCGLLHFKVSCIC